MVACILRQRTPGFRQQLGELSVALVGASFAGGPALLQGLDLRVQFVAVAFDQVGIDIGILEGVHGTAGDPFLLLTQAREQAAAAVQVGHGHGFLSDQRVGTCLALAQLRGERAHCVGQA